MVLGVIMTILLIVDWGAEAKRTCALVGWCHWPESVFRIFALFMVYYFCLYFPKVRTSIL